MLLALTSLKLLMLYSHNIITRQADSGLGKWIVRWIENWQNIQVQRGAISSIKPTGGWFWIPLYKKDRTYWIESSTGPQKRLRRWNIFNFRIV